MRPLSKPNIEAELSYAYLHAVAAHAGMTCHLSNSHQDDNGIDAVLTAWGPFENGGEYSEIDIKVQLKATIHTPAESDRYLSYFLKGVERYNDLRAETTAIPRILVVLFLPSNLEEWLEHTTQQLALRRCAYWESLRGAPKTSNATGTTIRLPTDQFFNARALKGLAARLSRRDIPRYSAA